MRTANAVRKIVLKCSSLKLRRLCRPCLRLLYLRRYAAYVAALPLPGVIGLTRWGKPWGRSGDHPYRDCAYPSTRWATETVGQAVWALWGSPLQGLRVSFDAAGDGDGGASHGGALGIAPTGIARILRRSGASHGGAKNCTPTALPRFSQFSVLCSLFSTLS
jgi:hypothetical protein